MKKVIVTGGAGFIGLQLTELLLSRGYHVVIIGDFSTGKVTNIEPLLKNMRVEFIQNSITDLPYSKGSFPRCLLRFSSSSLVQCPPECRRPLSLKPELSAMNHNIAGKIG